MIELADNDYAVCVTPKGAAALAADAQTRLVESVARLALARDLQLRGESAQLVRRLVRFTIDELDGIARTFAALDAAKESPPAPGPVTDGARIRRIGRNGTNPLMSGGAGEIRVW